MIKFGSFDEAAKIAAQTEYGLSLGILTKDVMGGLELARRIPTGIVHINAFEGAGQLMRGPVARRLPSVA